MLEDRTICFRHIGCSASSRWPKSNESSLRKATPRGSDYWPLTSEGRILALLLSIYGLAVFGYITASFASFFVGRDAAAPHASVAGTADIQRMVEEVRELRLLLARSDT